jgi:acyl-CoA synthetase (AMP-forming)/AMP-acid ligase II
VDTNIGLLLAKRGALNTSVEALVDVAKGRRYTFGELDRRANRIAHVARARGIETGDRVALLMMNGVEYVESFFGLAKIGAVVVPLNWRLVPDELAYILANAGARMLVYGSEFAHNVAELHARGGGEGGTEIRQWIEVGEAGARQPFAAHYESEVERASTAAPPLGARDDDLLFIMYTSGTTGLPKGSMHSHESFLWAVITFAVTAELRFKDRYAIALPAFHVGALLPMVINVYRGITNVVLREFDPVVMWRVFEAERINATLAVPSMLNSMLQVPSFERYDYSSLRWVISGATPVPVTLIERYAAIGIEVHQAYGLTESGGPACMISPDDALVRIGSTGKAFFHTEVRVVDERGGDAPPGVPGELLVKGRHIMKGYWRNPEATRETIRDGWLHTGDIAIADEDGFITIHDRIKDMVISGGENVYPAEIENVILQHPAVAEVAVIGVPSARWGESPFAVVVPKAGHDLTEADVLRHCDGRLARFKMPKGAAFIDAIPRNPTGKALKRVLRERFPDPAPE